MFHYREVSTSFDEPQTAIEVTHERSDGSFIIGHVATHGATWFAYTLGYHLLCDAETLLPVLFSSVEGAANALTEPAAYHLMPRYP